MQHETLNYEALPREALNHESIDDKGWGTDWAVPEREAAEDDRQSDSSHVETRTLSTDLSDWEAGEIPEPVTADYADDLRTGERPAGEESDASGSEGSIPWRWILSAAMLVLIFAGNRFLSGELFLVAFFALIAAQWLLGRNNRAE